MIWGESNNGESNSFVETPRRIPTYIASSESVSESSPIIYSPPSRVISESICGESVQTILVNDLDTPRIRQLKKELAELENELKILERKRELDLEKQIREAKQKVKRYKV